MKRGATFKIEGLKELDDALGDLPEAAAKGVLRRVGRDALVVFDEAWRANAPVGETGRLHKKGGIGSKLSRGQRKAIEREAFVEVFAGPGPHPEGQQVEFGNSHQSAQPFVRPAWDATKDKVLDRVVAGLRPEILKSKARVDRAVARRIAKAAAADEG